MRLRGAHADSVRDEAIQALNEFMSEQRAILSRVTVDTGQSDGGVEMLLDESGAATKRAQLKQTMDALTAFAA